MTLKQIYPSQYEILKELFGPNKIEDRYSRLNDIYRACEQAWEKNLNSRLRNTEIKYLLIGEAAPWTQNDKIRYFYTTFDELTRGRNGVRSSNLTQDIDFVIITHGKTIKDRV